MILNNHWHTCQPGDMPPNMDGGLLLSHPCIVPFPYVPKITTPIIGISKQCMSHNIGPLTLRLIQLQQYFQPQF